MKSEFTGCEVAFKQVERQFRGKMLRQAAMNIMIKRKRRLEKE